MLRSFPRADPSSAASRELGEQLAGHRTTQAVPARPSRPGGGRRTEPHRRPRRRAPGLRRVRRLRRHDPLQHRGGLRRRRRHALGRRPRHGCVGLRPRRGDHGRQHVVVIAAGVATAAYALRAWRRWSVVLFLLVVLAGQLALANLVKIAVERVRPDAPPFHVFTGPSFPSGHATAAAATWAAVALVLSRGRSPRARATLGGVAVGIAVAVACSRVFLGAHWTSDVIGGLLLGWTWYAICAVAFGGRVLRLGAPAEQAAATAPPGGAGLGAGESRSDEAGDRAGLGRPPSAHASVRTLGSRAHCRVLAAAMKASTSAAPTTPASFFTPAAFRRASPPPSAAIALRWPSRPDWSLRSHGRPHQVGAVRRRPHACHPWPPWLPLLEPPGQNPDPL